MLHGADPVSYTHLLSVTLSHPKDAGKSKSRFFDKNLSHVILTVKKAVSYTHLDVYKRQPFIPFFHLSVHILSSTNKSILYRAPSILRFLYRGCRG